MLSRDDISGFMYRLQDEITEGVATIDGDSFHEDTWERDGGGGGRSRVIQEGKVFEKAGVNVSVVHGELSESAMASMGGGRDADPTDRSFFATGISLVIHPKNPHAPTVHANYRYFERGEDGSVWWFGGGADLTPSYLYEEDAQHFHQVYFDLCQRHDVSNHAHFKKWCDEYFYIKHRGEGRGLGGIFFDNLSGDYKKPFFNFIQDAGRSFLPSYTPIIERRKDMPFDDEQKRWQQIRRGRYIEFNLVYDRGTTFGLKTGGRIESILMSLPLTARYEYDHHPEAGSKEAELVAALKSPRDWHHNP